MAQPTTATKSPPGAVYDMAATFQQEVDAGVTAAHDQMLAAWGQTYQQVRADYDALLGKMAEAKAKGQVMSPAWLYQQERLKNALATTKAQVHVFAQQASDATVQAHLAAVKAGAKAASSMGAQSLAEAGVGGSFASVNPDNLKHLVGFTADGGPVAALFTSLAAETAQMARDALVRGVTLGKGVDWITARLEQALNVPRWRAETIVRTESQRLYREVSRQTYLANDDLLEGWVWVAKLDSRSCPACVAMDGTVHPIGTTLDGHPRCRCAMVPRTKSWADLGVDDADDTRPPIRDGQAWFKGQPSSVQRAILGNRRYHLWKSGEITLDDMVARPSSPTWGTMRRERSLREIKDGVHPNYADKVEPPPPPPPMSADPAAVANITATHTIDEIEATLTGMPLTEQGRLNFLAAHQAKIAELPKGPRFVLPEPDPAWVGKATEKMNSAVLTKGYPSKGYSQTVAIYKAKANGVVGQKVGVVKSLSWQEKVNAQKALAEHDAWLENHLATKAATKSEGKAIVDMLDENLAMAEVDQHVMHDLGEALDSTKYLVDPVERARTQAIIHAKMDAYDNAKAEALGFRQASEDWVNKDGDLLHIDDTGWGQLTYADGNLPQNVHPHLVSHMLKEDDWDVPTPEPNPEKVAQFVDTVFKTPAGYYDEGFAKMYLSSVEKGLVTDAQTLADMQEALKVAQASLPWKPEPQYVAKILAEIESQPHPAAHVQTLKGIAGDVNTKPLSKANILEAVAQWEAKVAEAAKPVVVQPNGTAVNTILKNLQSGKVDVEHVKGKADGLTTKSAQIKANNAEALAQWQAKNPPLPDAPDHLVAPKLDLLEQGKISAAEVNTMVEQGMLPTEHVNSWKVALHKYEAKTKPPATTPPPSTTPGWGHPPDPADLKSTGQTLGTHGAKVYTDPQGNRWLFKPPKDAGDQFLATLDEAASRLQARTGLKAPDTYVVTLDGRRGSIQRMFDAKGAFPGGLKPSTLTEPDLLAVQKEHVLDWLLSNHDGHHEQFLRLPDGTLTGIDKGQAFRWMGQDRLDWDFHPNAAYGAPEPVYNVMWREFAHGGKAEMLDPRHGPLADYIKSVQGISDDEIRTMFRPYAEQAAARGKLAVRQSQPGLKVPSIPANDVDAFLDAIVARKNALSDDFTALYDKAAKARAKALPEWKPRKPPAAPRTTGKAKWKDRPKPVKPEPPKAPAAEVAEDFDPWLSKVKAKYEAFAPGKKLENSNNWARVRRVIDQRDRQAVQELLDRHYLDEDLAAEALKLIDEAETKAKALEAAHDAAMAAYERDVARWKKDMADWREANGIVDLTLGMDDDVIRHTTNQQGLAWGSAKMKDPGWTKPEIDALRYYTTSSGAHSLNSTGRRLAEKGLRDTSAWGAEATRVKHIDKAMAKSTIPEDVILHRGTGFEQFSIGGERLGYGDAHRLADLVGSVQVDWGYMSTSVGKNAAFDHSPVQIKFRAPAGTRGSYVVSFSHYGSSERELLLDRGTHFYVHAVYKQGGQYVVEAEIVPPDFDPAMATPKPSRTPFSPS